MQRLPMISLRVAARDAAELGVHVLVDEVGIEQRDAARGELEHGAETRVGAAPDDVGLAREQQRAHRGDEHGRVDRVREIAVTAGRQSLLVIVVRDERGRQMHDGQKGRMRPRTQPPAHFETVDVGQIDVEHDEADVLFRRGQRLGARGRFDDLESSGAQDARRGVERRRIVVDDDDLLVRDLVGDVS